ncbi:MAG TPA: hypothetical protein VFR85_00285 [Anaeromyxobacteraceae bacterium]|nr:hypothetical protein [Anaeromyxobacteraceae bacterium]
MLLRYLMPSAVILSVLVCGCEKQESPKVTAGEVKEKVKDAAGAAAGYARQERDEYVARAQKAVDEGKAEIDKLRAETRQAGAGARNEAQRQLEAVEAKWKVAERKLHALKSAGGEAWKDLRSGVDEAVDDLKRALGSS